MRAVGSSTIWAVLLLVSACGDSAGDSAGASGGSTSAATNGAPTTDATTEAIGDSATSGTSTSGSGSASDSSHGSTCESTSGGFVDPLAPCDNGLQDLDETDVDCGGAACGGCQDGQGCLVDADCASATCAVGVCVTPGCVQDADCAALDDACNTGTCDPNTNTCAKTPATDGTTCDDGDLCSTASSCQAGICTGGAPKDCSSLTSICGTGVCDGMTGECTVMPIGGMDGKACDDSNACTTGTACQAGRCGDPNDPGYTFHEDFADNSAGWTVGPNWQIAPAMLGCGDPGIDHSPSDDNGVAGVELGGCVPILPVDPNKFLCLTSPKIDTSALDKVLVTYWRTLTSDYAPFMKQRVEVWNGNSWTSVFDTTDEFLEDSWVNVTHDVSAHKNAAMQIRWCYSIGSSGAFYYGGWNVDDVTVGPIACTP